MLVPSAEEQALIDRVVETVRQAIAEGRRIELPKPRLLHPSETALLTVGLESNPFGGTLGPYRYQFEGEDDLLHLFVVRLDQLAFSVDEAQAVFSALLPDLNPGLVWIKPGEQSHHFYFGHEELGAGRLENK